MRGLGTSMIVITAACGFHVPAANDDAGTDSAETVDWWSPEYAYRRQIIVTATDAVAATYSVKFVADTMALRAAGKVSATGDDWRVVRRSGDRWEELDRWIDDARGGGWSSTDTHTWFALPAAIAGTASDGDTYVYYGGSTMVELPPDDLDRVFLFGDDFESGAGKWLNNGLGEQVVADTIRVGGLESLRIETGGLAASGVHHDIALPAVPMMWSHWVRQAQANRSFSFARSFDCAFAMRMPASFVDPHLRLATELDSGGKMQIWTNPLDNWSPSIAAGEWHQVDTVFDGSANIVTTRFDNGPWHTPPATSPYYYLQGTPSYSIALEGEGGQPGTFWVDNYIIRRYVQSEPTTQLGPETALPR